MMKKTFLIWVFAVLCLTMAVSVHGAAGASPNAVPQVFFEALYDVPVMPGLEELKDQAILFDKPDGRIASVTAVSKTLEQGDISRFYADAMPALGWKNTNKNQYVRGRDLLTIEFSSNPPYTVAKLTLSPRS